MKKKILFGFCLAAALPLITAVPAHAADFLIDWGSEGFAMEPGYTPHNSTAGNSLTLYAKILSFSATGPFSSLNATGNQYTLVIGGMTSAGTFTEGPYIFKTPYSDGTFTVYEDPVADADFANPGTFSNSPAIIVGTVSAVLTQLNDFTWLGCPPGVTGTYFANFIFTGGSAVPGNVIGCGGDIDATWTDDPCMVAIPVGYNFQSNGHFQMICPTFSTDEDSWGNVKKLFR